MKRIKFTKTTEQSIQTQTQAKRIVEFILSAAGTRVYPRWETEWRAVEKLARELETR